MSILLDEMVVAEQYREATPTEVQQVAAQQGGAAVTEITSGTTTVTAPGDGSRNIELPQVLGTGASPTFANLTLTGQIQVGGGSAVKKIATGTVSIDPGSINAQTRGSVTFTLTGAAVGDVVVMQPPGALNTGLVFAGAEVTAANTVTVYLGNLTGGPIDDGGNTWRWLHFDLT